jgi:protocatechuate 3,4-dioxygenase beta subunit
MIKSILAALIGIVFVSIFLYPFDVTRFIHSRKDKLQNMALPNSRGGSISGRIVDSQGYPIAKERVHAVSEKFGDANHPGAYSKREASALTDTQGNYRIEGLAPGDYIVSIGPSLEGRVYSHPGNRTYYAKRYYPDTGAKENAKPIEVKEGTGVPNINITAGEMKNTVEIRGHAVIAGTGQPIAGVTLSYDVPGGGALGAGVGAGTAISAIASSSNDRHPTNRTNEKGEFLITGVIPGKYRITLDRRQNHDIEYFAEPTDFDVAEEGVRNLIVKMRRGAIIRGKVEAQGTNDPEMLAKVSELRINAIIRPKQSDPFPPDGNRSAQVGPDGTFILKGIKPGKVSISVNSTGRDGGVFQLDRIEYKGVNIDREGIEIVEGENLANLRLIAVYGAITVRGRLKINGELPESVSLRLVVLRQGDASGPPKFADIDAQGQFAVPNLSAGIYFFRLQSLRLGRYGGNDKTLSEAIHRAEQKVAVSENDQQPIVLTLDLNKTQ